MCGIAGFTHRDGSPDPARITAAIRAIHHRGPDQSGIWESSHVSLGAVRLKIIDLKDGAQPIRSSDGNSVIVFNGEVYNHLEIRRELEQRGHKFHSRCDTETVLAAFLEWDIASLAKLRGMFAFAIWQERERRLVLVRDRMGIKPLYVAERDGNVMFGSEMKVLFPWIERRIDRAGLAVYLTRNYPSPDRTLIEGVRKLSPGTLLEWRDGVVREEAYWRLSMNPRKRDLGEAKEELDGLLRSAIKEHLLSDVPLGVWASGGLDSSTVLHYAAEQVPTLKTFSVSFRGRKFDESRWFREVAKAYGTEHNEFDLNPEQDLVSTIEQLPFFSDEPSADAGALPVYFLSKMCRAQVTVALSGEGADELFGGYATYLADSYAAVARRLPAPIRRAALGVARLLPASDDKISFEYKLKRFLAGSLLPPAEAHFFWNGAHENGELMPRFAIPESSDFLLLDQQNYLVEDILNKCDRMSMAHSLEVRPPFLDHRIVEFANSLPHDLKIRGGTLKFLLRDLMRTKLPASVIERKKEGFDIPVHHWFRTVLRELLLDTLSGAPRDLVDMKKVRQSVDDHMARRANRGYQLWGLLILFLWMKRWNVATA